jgi:hypothetical protein
MSVWEGKGVHVPDEQRWETKWQDKPEEVFSCPLKEEFFVLARGSTYFFLTRSGYLYYADKPAKGQRQLKQAWSNKEPPIKTVVTDVDTGMTYLFGTVPWETKKRFFFELSEKRGWCCSRKATCGRSRVKNRSRQSSNTLVSSTIAPNNRRSNRIPTRQLHRTASQRWGRCGAAATVDVRRDRVRRHIAAQVLSM